MVRGGPGSYTLRMNDSEIEAEIHTLRDGGLLMQASFFFRTCLYLLLLATWVFVLLLIAVYI